MACGNKLVFLGCEYSGVGYTSRPVEKDATTIQLMKGQGNNFPTLTSGSHFYVSVEGCNSCCETMKVVGRDGDKLQVERGYGNACSCISSNARVSYTTNVEPFFNDINSVVPLNVISPLSYDCTTNTLSVDCAALFRSGCGGGCDCGEGCEDNATPSVSGGSGGLRGERGPQGERGPSVTGIAVSASGKLVFTFSDGSTVSATGTLPKGQKGDKGDKGDAGAGAATLLSGKMDGTSLVLTLSDDTEITVDNVKGDKGDTGEQGEQGETGPQGVKGDKGDGASYMVYANSKWYVYGTPSTAHSIQYSGMNIPFTTNADGIAELSLSLIPKGSLVRILRDSKVVGIGVV